MLEQSVLAGSSASQNWSIVLTWTVYRTLYLTGFHVFPQPSWSYQIFLCDIRVRYWAKIYSMNINSIPIGEIPTKVFRDMCYIIWESHCTKIILARFLKLTVLYICINESVWHANAEHKFFRKKFVKRLRPAEKSIVR